MKVHVYPADDGGCGFYRLTGPARACLDRGADITIVPPGTGWQYLEDEATGSVEGIYPDEPALQADVVVMQRPMDARSVDLIRHFQHAGVAVVVELDDDIRHLPAKHAIYHETHPRTSPQHNWQHLVRACRVANLVTCSTRYLAKAYGGVYLPNCIPSRYLSLPSVPETLIGWTGAVMYHPDDLNVTRGAVGRVLASRPELSFLSIGPPDGVREALRIQTNQFNSTGWVSMDSYPSQMARLRAGVVPLQPIGYNDAKSWLKGLEMAALGVPFVASPTEPYRELHDLGAGVLAPSPRHWERSLLALLDGPVDSIVQRGREAASTLTIEAHAWKWLDAWKQAKDSL